jgi:phthalate 4,5-dioxygenase oxygenase subunit
MLSAKDNELLTRVEGDAPMGQMLRDCFWVPAVRAARLEPDGAPLRVRLFGEDFVAWRATDGRVGFFDEACPHRRASLALARNGDCALTCIFHGWKMDVSGKVLETPNEAINPKAFAARQKVAHYPVRETGGMIWVYLGKRDIPPRFPDFEFTVLDEAHNSITSATIPCNWVQGLEASLDDAHVGILHESFMSAYKNSDMSMWLGPAPVYEVDLKPYGFAATAIRQMPNGRTLAATTHFAMPWYGFVSTTSTETTAGPRSSKRVIFISVPIDDVNFKQWFFSYDIEKPVDVFFAGTETYDRDEICPPLGGPETVWGQDREAMKRGHATGFTNNLLAEDTAVQMSMGRITDRTREQLCSADKAIGFARQVLLDSVRAWRNGETPRGASPDIDWRGIRAFTVETESGDGREARRA